MPEDRREDVVIHPLGVNRGGSEYLQQRVCSELTICMGARGSERGWQLLGTRALHGTVRGAEPLLLVERPAQAQWQRLERRFLVARGVGGSELTICMGARGSERGREDPQPDSNPSQLRFAVQRTFSAELRREAESKKACLEGGKSSGPKTEQLLRDV
ncbi:hypothetical protein AK812_SmicGene4762 [Symbiodinium microadriaticum]|uniref:Uncharacterized protein n=1 Tax=Symbiodinium microadriaticum TaxID=2951 RepID=A0A1Q9EVG3_SYMMI|nr:hypothetical protein AK812_SmicGene4762 [Symbiodinium microadriaticum]